MINLISALGGGIIAGLVIGYWFYSVRELHLALSKKNAELRKLRRQAEET